MPLNIILFSCFVVPARSTGFTKDYKNSANIQADRLKAKYLAAVHSLSPSTSSLLPSA